MNLLPYLSSTKEVCDGLIIKAFDYCKKNCKSQKCAKFYDSIIKERQTGFLTCPFGLVSFIYCCDDYFQVFTGFRCKGFYRKNTKFSDDIYSPILDESQLLGLMKESVDFSNLKQRAEDKISIFQENNHEIKKLNSQIKEHCDSLISTYVEKNDVYSLTPDEYTNLFKRIKTLYVISNLISFRNSLIDFEQQPDSLGIGRRIVIDIYRKFDKYSKVLREYDKNISIHLTGSSYKRIQGYPSFELIPFLILENATKYTTPNKSVEVNFLETENNLEITISSYGPHCSEEEIKHIFERGFRGYNAQKKATGSGLGLFFVKELCKIHKIDIKAKSGNPSRKGEILCSDFVIKLYFNEVLNSDALR